MPAAAIYRERRAQHLARIEELKARERMLSVARVICVVLALLAAWKLGWWLLAPLAVFIGLMVIHERFVRRRVQYEAGARFCERGIERIERGPTGSGILGEEFAEERHPYALDLDLFGKQSLYELLCIANTAAGRSILAGWLLHPARREEILDRQLAVGELRDRLGLREQMAVLAGAVAGTIEEAKLDEWSQAAPVLTSGGQRIAARVIGTLSGLALLNTLPMLWDASWHGGTPLFVMVLVVAVFGRKLTARVREVIAAVERSEPALALLAYLVERLERERFTTPRLAALRAMLERDGVPASKQIARLRGLVALLDARRNQLFAPIAAALLWTTNVAFAIERWRLESGREIVRWIAAVGEIEALSSLASFAFEHPAFAMPEVLEGEAVFEATAVGHPLIPDARRITNDLRLGGKTRLLIISGSNMSGKSTMLRTIGTNTVLALAGAPVCASSLRVATMNVGASIRLVDSLQEGSSRFYAEITRIRQIVDMAGGEPPLLFLLDEILHGTNSHDRRIGAEAIVRGLVERGAVGAVSTHDLALARIAESLPGAVNVHFEDQLEEGVMRFDYRMRPGVVEKSNALELMRSVGIEV